MGMIAWNDAMATGVAAFDRNHQRLIDFINQLDGMHVADPDSAIDAATLAALADFARHGLTTEEDLLHVTAYPDLDIHRQAHQRFARFIHDQQTDHLDGRTIFTADILAFLALWLSDHVLDMDAAATAYLRPDTRALAC